ncbi:MAG: calcium-binding protein [Rhodobacteraceae bacterium]|nr:calcium-binding protein [Paracoccaceae bacterium]
MTAKDTASFACDPAKGVRVRLKKDNRPDETPWAERKTKGKEPWKGDNLHQEGANQPPESYDLTLVKHLIGTEHNDRIDGNHGDNSIEGRGGNDRLWGSGGNDTLIGGPGDDDLGGAAGHDTLIGGDGKDNLDGGADRDTLEGGPGADVLDGGAGWDTATYANSPDGVTVSLDPNKSVKNSGGDAAGDTLVRIEHLIGSVHNDTLTGDDSVNWLEGGAGQDVLNGLGGDDRLYGGIGKDMLHGGDGDDVLDGGAHNDVLNGDADDDELHGRGGNDTLDGGAGNDVLNGDAHNDELHGGAGSDTLTGGTGDDTLYGRRKETLDGGVGEDTLTAAADGNDRLYGGVGKDTLYGQGGDDRLHGEDGGDRLDGGAGNDLLTGGGTVTGADGADTFVFRVNEDGRDTITDFKIGVDTIEFDISSGSLDFETLMRVSRNLMQESEKENAVLRWKEGAGITLKEVSWDDLKSVHFEFVKPEDIGNEMA